MSLTATFTGTNRKQTVHGLTQWDRGRTLTLSTAAVLPEEFEVHFASKGSDVALTVSGYRTVPLISIPNELLTTGSDITAWVCFGNGSSQSTTAYTILLPVTPRARPANYV